MGPLLNTCSKKLLCALLIFTSFSASAQSADKLREADGFFKKGQLKEAQEIYLQYASDLSLDQQSNLGLLYLYVDQANKDYTTAMQWFQKAAAKGHTKSMTYIGALYKDGLGVAKDTVTSFKWYKKAADLNDKDALVMMGAMYQLGINVKADESQAIYWYKTAGEKGNTKGYYYLGDIYLKKQLYNTAVDWFRKGADWGDGDCLVKLGMMYQEGNGVIKDEDEATLFYEKIIKYENSQTWSSSVTYKQASYARKQIAKMGSVAPSSNSNQLKPALWQIASGFANGFSGLLGKSFSPADKNGVLGLSDDTYYRCTVNTGLKNAYIKKEVMKDVKVPGFELRKGTYYYYNADVVTDVNQEKADEVYTEWVSLLKAAFPNFSVRTSTENGKAHYFTGYANGKEIVISLYNCCPARNNYDKEISLSIQQAQ